MKSSFLAVAASLIIALANAHGAGPGANGHNIYNQLSDLHAMETLRSPTVDGHGLPHAFLASIFSHNNRGSNALGYEYDHAPGPGGSLLKRKRRSVGGNEYFYPKKTYRYVVRRPYYRLRRFYRPYRPYGYYSYGRPYGHFHGFW